MKKIAILASGSGTNARNIISYFSTEKGAVVSLVMSNRPDAFVLERARNMSVETVVFDRTDFYESGKVLDILIGREIDLVVLAGFLWLVPESLVDRYRGRILNIHPALLPAYGGKGMYGERVHRAVIGNREERSGITIHLVNNKYDEGDILFQATCPVLQDDTPDTLAQRVHELEYRYYPVVIEKYLENPGKPVTIPQ
ncbi:MAG: phosphoribosylglycinamide formyltransferase [Bacteroidales bacterium]